MKTHNAQNERIKRTYFTYLAEAKGFSEATLDAGEQSFMAASMLRRCAKTTSR